MNKITTLNNSANVLKERSRAKMSMYLIYKKREKITQR